MIALLPAAPARADSFVLGSTNNTVSYTFDGVYYLDIGAGSFDVSELNGVDLPWVYCVDLLHEISPDDPYLNTAVRTDGSVNGSLVDHADQVAWLLGAYASSAAGNSAAEAALQGLIWEAIYGTRFTFDPVGAQATYFDDWFEASYPSGNVASYLWLTPDSRCLSATSGYGCVQGLVTDNSVPDPGSTLALLSVGLIGLGAWRRRHP